MASFITHPDYLREYRARLAYQELLAHLARLRLDGTIWCALPREVDQWWRERSQMRLRRHNAGWQIEGPGHERARLAYAYLDGDRLCYSLEGAS